MAGDPALVEQVAVGAEALAALDGDHEHLDVVMADITAEVARVVGGRVPRGVGGGGAGCTCTGAPNVCAA